jgi:hypothetical protein
MTKQTTLELADFYDNFDGSVYSTPAKANAVMSCMLQEAAEELRRMNKVNTELLEALKICDGNIASLLASQHPRVYSEWLSVVRAAITKAEGGAV